MRPVDHDAADADDAGIRVCGKRIDDRLRLGEGFRRRREQLVDDRYLRRVNGELPGKAVAARLFAFAAKTVVVAEVDINGVERRYLGGSRAGETERARQP